MEVSLTTPIKKEDLLSLKLGDIVYLNGRIYTSRDEAHLRALKYHKEGRELPVDLNGATVFHCGPIVRRRGDDWELIAAGPTTSARMNSMEPEFIKKFGVGAIIGKGGMSTPTIETMEECGSVYLVMTGGAALLAAKGVSEVKGVHWLDLGMPEALWVFEVSDFGPLVVGIDAHANSLYEAVVRDVEMNLIKVRKRLGLDE